MTPAEAAQACGVTERTIRGRIERGSLRTVKRGGRVHIATADLLSAGLLPVDYLVSDDPGETGNAARGKSGSGKTGMETDLVQLLRDTQADLLRETAEHARAKALLETAEVQESRRMEAERAAQDEIVRLRAKVMELEARAATPAEVEQQTKAGETRAWWQRMIGGTGA